MSEDQRRFKIDLDKSRAPRAFRDSENLWRDDIRRIHRLLERHVRTIKDIEERQDDRGDERPHLSIAIFGPSGSGKSSLLRTLAADVNRHPNRRILRDELGKVSTLPVTDPTTWAQSDRFLYAFLAAALEEERKSKEHREKGYPRGLSPVQLAFQEVNEYLRVVDEPASSEEHDPLGLSLQKLERHTSALRLKGALDRFIEALAEGLNSDVVLLPVDDLDLSPDHLVPSLQAYQSFLMHPKLVPIFCFTDRMPEELIEAHYEQRLTSGVRRFEQNAERLSISQQLSVQFLARCFPVRNRIRLGPAPARVQRALFDLRLENKEEKETLEILELLTISSFLLFGYPDEGDGHQVRAALRPSTLRRQFQVIDAMADCRLHVLRSPQLAMMANPNVKNDNDKLERIAPTDRDSGCSSGRWENWDGELPTLEILREKGSSKPPKTGEGQEHWFDFLAVARNLRKLDIGVTWATVFNGAVWSLLNVHRDTLRELGLHLEDLYSWSPKELRSVVLRKILSQDRPVRRTVVDRWFNRTDYRRNQVLSLLAANIFRPWMIGEEPYGDEEGPIREQLELEKADKGHPSIDKDRPFIDKKWPRPEEAPRDESQIWNRVSFSAYEGLLWFFNVSLGFYLPQIMARNWADSVSSDEPVRGYISGNGWDLRHAPINAARVADVKKEAFSFGMLFLDPQGYRNALKALAATKIVHEEKGQIEDYTQEEKRESERRFRAGEELSEDEKRYLKLCSVKALSGEHPHPRGHLLLRIWSCCGFSRGRYWAVFSLWRGLGFIGQALELSLRNKEALKKLRCCSTAELKSYVESLKKEKGEEIELKEETDGKEGGAKQSAKRGVEAEQSATEKKKACRSLYGKIHLLIRSHCLEGLVPGPLLGRGSDEGRVLHGFSHWEPLQPKLEAEIKNLAGDLVIWLAKSFDETIFPLPAGRLKVGWGDCFIRRIHGDSILGALWPRLNAAYLEEQTRYEPYQKLARRRTYGQQKIEKDIKKNDQLRLPKGEGSSEHPTLEDRLLEYPTLEDEDDFRWTAALAAGAWSDLVLEYWRGCPSILRLLLACPVFLKSREHFFPCPENGAAQRDMFGRLATSKRAVKETDDDSTPEAIRYAWLDRLSLPAEDWKYLKEIWKEGCDIPGIVTEEFCVERVGIDSFFPLAERFAVTIDPTIAVKERRKEGDKEKWITKIRPCQKRDPKRSDCDD